MSALAAAGVRADRAFQPNLLASQKEVWDQLTRPTADGL
jgi:hypothetical protein